MRESITHISKPKPKLTNAASFSLSSAVIVDQPMTKFILLALFRVDDDAATTSSNGVTSGDEAKGWNGPVTAYFRPHYINEDSGRLINSRQALLPKKLLKSTLEHQQ